MTEGVKVTIGSKTYTFAALGSATAAGVVTALVAAWAALDASLFPEFAEITPSLTSTATLTLTATTAGKPFSATVTSVSAAGTVDGVIAGSGSTGTTTAGQGPNDWSVAANWSGAAVPITGDAVIIDDGTFSILYGLAQSGVTLASLTVTAAFQGNGTIGLPATNADAAEYPEYRQAYLAIGATLATVGAGQGNGSGRIKLDTGSAATTLTVYRTGSGSDNGVPALLWKGTSASNVVNVYGGSDVGIAVYGGETADVSGGLTLQGGSSVRCGPGVTLAAIVVDNSSIEINSAIGTSLTMDGSSAIIWGTGAVAQLTMRDSTVTYNTSGTLGGATLLSGSSLIDFSQDQRSKTVTNPIDLYGASAFNDPNKVTGAIVLDFDEEVPGLGLGRNVRITRGTPS